MRYPQRHHLPETEDYLTDQLGQITLIGKSIAGVETVFAIPQFGLVFDTGRAPPFSWHHDTVALTHWHLDHSGGLATILGMRCLHSLKSLNLVVPSGRYEESLRYFDSLKKITESRIQCTIVPASDEYQLSRNLRLRALPASHCIENTGYAVYSSRKKLKPEYRNASEHELVKLKASGIDVNASHNDVLLAFSGDACGEFMLHEDVQRARVLIMECSFFGEDQEYEKCRHYGHTHILDWMRHADKLCCETIIMSHTSLRYSKAEIEEVCRNKLPKSVLERLVIWRA